MNFEMLGNFGDFVGGIAVVITLAYLGYQIRQNTKEVRNNSIQALLERSIHLFEDNINSPLPEILDKLENGSTISQADKWRVEMFVRRNFQLYELVFLKHKECRISQQVMDAYKRRMIATMTRPYFATCWPMVKQFYTDDFAHYVDSLEALSDQKASVKK